jgi:hypothetical protein
LNPNIGNQINIIKQKAELIILIDKEIAEKEEKLRIGAEEIDDAEGVEVADWNAVFLGKTADVYTLVIVRDRFSWSLSSAELNQLTKEKLGSFLDF